MSETTNENPQPYPEQLSDVLLVMDKEKKKIQAVTGIDENGNLKTVDPLKKNQSQFMRVDKAGDLFTNFFSNFWRQLKDPTHFSFFKVSASEAVATAKEIQKQLKTPTKEGEAILAKHQVEEPKGQQQEVKEEKEQQQEVDKPKEQQENKKDVATVQDVSQTTVQAAQTPQATQEVPKTADTVETVKATETTEAAQTQSPQSPDTAETAETKNYRYKPEDIDWETLKQLGVKKDTLEKMGAMETLLMGYKTDFVMPISVNLGTVILRSEARLGLQQDADEKTVFVMYGVRHEPNLKNEFFGHTFTKEDRENLLKSGNMGRVVELTNLKTGEKMPSIISIDHLTNEVIALRQDWMRIPDTIKGVKLNEEQKKDLRDGKPVLLEGLEFKNSQNRSAHVQYNADKRRPEFLFGDRAPKQAQENNPKVFRGKEFSDEEYKKLTAGRTLYVSDFKDGRGQPYKGYVRVDGETGAYQFSFRNPDMLRDKIQPTEAHRTQVAVNSHGKTNEATRHIREPLRPEQQRPRNRAQQQRQNAPNNNRAKSRGARV
ncbi:DUF3945 domain-containing protein [Proteiniphilum saccharofermentans]|uniref:DUF3945 domain-containing protein n=1 Tax=Proteiniphilum saccharofermentans TaxID=1642647 RepID=UPI0028B12759|nr:DUF4099 domain-containing protein [Proteiniphilum saccharofermentans]